MYSNHGVVLDTNIRQVGTDIEDWTTQENTAPNVLQPALTTIKEKHCRYYPHHPTKLIISRQALKIK